MNVNKLLFTITLLFFQNACNQVGTRDSGEPVLRSNEVAEANLRLGMAYMKRAEYEKSLEKLLKAKKADPNYPPTYNALGLLYQQIGRLEEAEKYYKQSISLDPNNSDTLNNYGFFLCSNDRYQDAQEAFKKAAKNPLYETPEIAIANAGTCALKNNNEAEAENYFREALSINPKIPPALLQMSQISYDQGNYLPARGYLQRYLEISKHTSKSLWLGIQIEEQLGDKDTLSSYALLLRNNFPDSDEAQKLRESGIR